MPSVLFLLFFKAILQELPGGPSACGEIFHVLTFRIYFTIQLAGRATYCQDKFLQGSLLLDFFPVKSHPTI